MLRNSTVIDDDGDTLHVDHTSFNQTTIVVENWGPGTGGYPGGKQPADTAYFHVTEQGARAIITALCDAYPNAWVGHARDGRGSVGLQGS